MDGNAGRLAGVSMGEIALTAGLGTMQDWALKNGGSKAAVSNAAGCRKQPERLINGLEQQNGGKD